MKKHTGFTLVEMLVVLAIAGILATVALPSYNAQVRKGKRTEAKTALMALLYSQEKYRANCSQYATVLGSADVCTGGTHSVAGRGLSDRGLYAIAMTSGTATSFSASATAVAGSSQDKDTGCTTLSLSQNQGTTVTAPPSCW